MRPWLTLALAAVIVVATYFAIVRVAEEKAGALAGGGTVVLDARSPAEWGAFGALLERLREWEQHELVAALVALQEDGDLWVAPDLAGQRSAVTVHSLGLVSRVFVRRDGLVDPPLPFPDLDAPEAAQRTFTTIRLAGTLFHELLHHGGLEDEDATYAREIEWYRGLRTLAGRLEGEDKLWFEWAVDSATQSAEAARHKAGGQTG